MNGKELFLILTVLSLAAPIRAADAPPEPPSERVSALAAEFKVTAEEVSGLRAKGMGWGEVRHALAISRKAGVPLADVVKLRESGMGWGSISQKYGFKLGEARTHVSGRVSREGGQAGREGRKVGGARREHGRGPRAK